MSKPNTRVAKALRSEMAAYDLKSRPTRTLLARAIAVISRGKRVFLCYHYQTVKSFATTKRKVALLKAKSGQGWQAFELVVPHPDNPGHWLYGYSSLPGNTIEWGRNSPWGNQHPEHIFNGPPGARYRQWHFKPIN